MAQCGYPGSGGEAELFLEQSMSLQSHVSALGPPGRYRASLCKLSLPCGDLRIPSWRLCPRLVQSHIGRHLGMETISSGLFISTPVDHSCTVVHLISL